MVGIGQAETPARRSSGILQRRRVPLEWPEDRDFRILSIDGGGIRGIFPAAFLAGLEERYLSGSSVSSYFDLITGTSTGGIIGIGLGGGIDSLRTQGPLPGAGTGDLPTDRSSCPMHDAGVAFLQVPLRPGASSTGSVGIPRRTDAGRITVEVVHPFL